MMKKGHEKMLETVSEAPEVTTEGEYEEEEIPENTQEFPGATPPPQITQTTEGTTNVLAETTSKFSISPSSTQSTIWTSQKTFENTQKIQEITHTISTTQRAIVPNTEAPRTV